MINESVKEKRALEKGEDTEEFMYTLNCTGIITHCSRTAGFNLDRTHTQSYFSLGFFNKSIDHFLALDLQSPV